MRTFASLADFAEQEGEVIGTSDWVEIDQERVTTFADATDDHQWIHTDPERAAQGPFGGPIAHGFLTLSLLPALQRRTYAIEGLRMGINYGLEKVRFPAPVPVGSRIRATVQLASVSQIDGGIQAVLRTTIEREGGDKPVCVAESVSRYLD
jgi:acyl dehydratase